MSIAEQYSHPQLYQCCTYKYPCGFTVCMRQSYLVPFSLRVAFAKILPKPSHPISLFMRFFDSHHWCFIGLCLTSACNKLPGGCSQAHTQLAHARRGALSLLHPNYLSPNSYSNGRMPYSLTMATALCQPHGRSIVRGVMGQRSLGDSRGSQQPDTRLTPRSHMTQHRPILLSHLRMRSTPLPNSITVSWEEVNSFFFLFALKLSKGCRL